MIGKQKNKNRKYPLITAFILILAVSAYFLYAHFRASREKEQSYAVENNISRIEYAWRHLRFAQGEEYIALSRELGENWQDLSRHYPVEAPQQFARTADWPHKAWQIGENLSRVEEFYREKNPEKSSEYLWAAETAYLEIKSENAIPDFSRELYDFYLAAGKISTAANKDELERILPEFKLAFTGIKERFAQYRTTSIMTELEAKVYTLDRQLDGPELRQTQEEMPAFIKEIYLNN